jgi:hypothetical protein
MGVSCGLSGKEVGAGVENLAINRPICLPDASDGEVSGLGMVQNNGAGGLFRPQLVLVSHDYAAIGGA